MHLPQSLWPYNHSQHFWTLQTVACGPRAQVSCLSWWGRGEEAASSPCVPVSSPVSIVKYSCCPTFFPSFGVFRCLFLIFFRLCYFSAWWLCNGMWLWFKLQFLDYLLRLRNFCYVYWSFLFPLWSFPVCCLFSFWSVELCIFWIGVCQWFYMTYVSYRWHVCLFFFY